MKKHDERIIHYGVPGMKWGVKKGKTSSGKGKVSKTTFRMKKSIKSRVKTYKKRLKGDYPTSQDALEAAKIRQKPVRAMSNSELNTVIKRMNLEQQYRDLTDKKSNRGKKRVDNMLKYVDTANKLADIYKKVR